MDKKRPQRIIRWGYETKIYRDYYNKTVSYDFNLSQINVGH